MSNRYATAMSKRTDKDLIKIITIERNDYEPLAVEAAEEEIKKRNLDIGFVEQTQNEFAEQAIAEGSKGVDQSVRFVHLLVDSIAYHVITFALLIAGLYVKPDYEGDLGAMEAVGFSLFFISFFGYYILMEYYLGKTLGKYITGTKVVLSNGEKPQLSDILKRTLLRLLPFDSITFISRKSGFHDEFSNTMVVRD